MRCSPLVRWPRRRTRARAHDRGVRARALTLLVAVAVVAGATGSTRAGDAGLPPLPRGWPRTLQLGLADSPGGAAALRRSAPFGFRYQYLAGGVNTGQGWATWNPGGSFASYVSAART